MYFLQNVFMCLLALPRTLLQGRGGGGCEVVFHSLAFVPPEHPSRQVSTAPWSPPRALRTCLRAPAAALRAGAEAQVPSEGKPRVPGREKGGRAGQAGSAAHGSPEAGAFGTLPWAWEPPRGRRASLTRRLSAGPMPGPGSMPPGTGCSGWAAPKSPTC